MVFTGEATVTGTSLELSSAGVDWHMSIRRLDGKSDPRFMEYQGKSVTTTDVATFLPSWRDLSWQHIAGSMFSNSKSCADDLTYNVGISARRGSSLSHEDVIVEFKAFMDSRL